MNTLEVLTIIFSVFAVLISTIPYLSKFFFIKKVRGFYAYDYNKKGNWLMQPSLSARKLDIRKLEYLGSFQPHTAKFGGVDAIMNAAKYNKEIRNHENGYHPFSYMNDTFRIYIPKKWIYTKNVSKLISYKVPK